MLTDLKVLIKKLNVTLTKSLEAAVGLSMSRTHYEISVEHFLLKVLDEEQSDFVSILNHFDIDLLHVRKVLSDGLLNFEEGNTTKPSFSPTFLELLQDAWTVGTLNFNEGEIRSGFVLLALLSKRSLVMQLGLNRILQPVSKSIVLAEFDKMTLSSIEMGETLSVDKSHAVSSSASDSMIHNFCENLTEKAKADKLDPVFGREKELDQMLDIFCRRRKNNPILVGEPGVGKTAIVEGLALRIAEGDVPEILKDVDVLSLDMTRLEAGASVKGEFEKRLTTLVEEVKALGDRAILFIDEAHRLIGAGGQAGNDAANILKPALSRGELRTVAATTWKEYKQYFEKDPALTRRFQLIKLDAPTDDDTVTILRGLKSRYIHSHGVMIRDDAVRSAVHLSSRYITGKNQPDKAIDLIDTCAARIKVSLGATPSVITHLEKEMGVLKREQDALESDRAHGVEVDAERIEEVIRLLEKNALESEALREKWQRELKLIAELQDVYSMIEQFSKREEDHSTEAQQNDNAEALAASISSLEECLAKRDHLKSELKHVQGDQPLVYHEVSPDSVAQVVSDWTGVPLGNVLRDESQTLLNLETILKRRIKGQDHAMDSVAELLKLAKTGLKTANQPMGIFLLVGPSGVGKTETALTLADMLFGGSEALTTINMSEFQERHSISRLIGSPPGYVGYGEGGVLTEAVRQRPYSVVLLDEVEKASLDVLNLFYQVFDKGSLTDGEGKEIDFSNTVIFLTSNLATDEITTLTESNTSISSEQVVEKIRPILSNWFKPALLARTTVIPYYALSREALSDIVALKLEKFKKQLWTQSRVELVYDASVFDHVAGRCTSVEMGARNVDLVLKREVMPRLSELLLTALCDEVTIKRVSVTVEADTFAFEVEHAEKELASES